MPDQSNEAFYDAEVAPALMDLARRCTERGMSLIATVSYDDEGSIGRTLALAPDAPATIRYLDALARSWCAGGAVNVDGFLLAVMEDARRTGHSSLLLKQLGVPLSPGTGH